MDKHAKSVIDELFPVKEVGENKHRQLIFIAAMADGGYIDNRTNFSSYESFVRLCRSDKIKPVFNQISFSKFIVRYLNYEIKDQKYMNRKYRVFHRK